MATIVKSDSIPFNWEEADWSTVTGVVRARDGVRGAWFLHDQYGQSVVVKSQADAESQVMGSVFLRCMGLNPPESRLIESKSSEGMALARLGENSDFGC